MGGKYIATNLWNTKYQNKPYFLPIFWKCCIMIMHYRFWFIGNIICFRKYVSFMEIKIIASQNIAIVYWHIVISIRPILFMRKSKGMYKFMYYSRKKQNINLGLTPIIDACFLILISRNFCCYINLTALILTYCTPCKTFQF